MIFVIELDNENEATIFKSRQMDPWDVLEWQSILQAVYMRFMDANEILNVFEKTNKNQKQATHFGTYCSSLSLSL